MNHYHHAIGGGSVAGAIAPSTTGPAPVHHHQNYQHNHQHNHHQQQQQLPIAPSPLVAAGHKRKLVSSNSASVVTSVNPHTARTVGGAAFAGASASASTTSNGMPRRDTAPAIVASPVQASAASATATSTSTAPAPPVSPSDYWKGLLNEWNVPILDTVGIEQDADGDGDAVDFLETTPDRIEVYQNIELLTAVRRRDLDTLKRIAAENAANNSTMNACNRFGESILHLACRKGSLDVVQLLVGEGYSPPPPGCDCSLLVRDDYGRTVLHDACWTIGPPWELIKLILKRAPVLWRVSDVRGHLALQYVPKSVWPQWTAFLTKNKDLLKRVMVHSYHGVDIAHQPMPKGGASVSASVSRQPSAAAAAATVVSNSNGSASASATTTTASSLVPPVTRSLPRHTSAHPPSIAQQANAVLARALAQANPAMVQALSRGVQPRQSKQGVQAMPPVLATPRQATQTQTQRSPPTALPTATTTTTATVHTQQQQQQQQQPLLVSAAAAAAPAPGPATAALDEALKAQAEMRAQKRSEQQQLLLQGAPSERLTHKSSLLVKQQQQHQQQHQQHQVENEHTTVRAQAPPRSSDRDRDRECNKFESKQAPIPYAPSISMIAKRLAGYQKATAIKDAQLKQRQQQQQQKGALRLQEESESRVQVVEVSSESQSHRHRHAIRNPLPAVPNPLLTNSENEAVLNEDPAQAQPPEVPTPLKLEATNNKLTVAEATGTSTQHTTTSKITSTTTAVPNPIILEEEEEEVASSVVPSGALIENSSEVALAGSQTNQGIESSDSSNSNNNSTSSLTMSASPSEAEQLESLSTTTTTTNSVSDREAAKVSASLAATTIGHTNDSNIREDGLSEESEASNNSNSNEKEDKDGVSSISDNDSKSDMETKKRIVG